MVFCCIGFLYVWVPPGTRDDILLMVLHFIHDLEINNLKKNIKSIACRWALDLILYVIEKCCRNITNIYIFVWF